MLRSCRQTLLPARGASGRCRWRPPRRAPWRRSGMPCAAPRPERPLCPPGGAGPAGLPGSCEPVARRGGKEREVEARGQRAALAGARRTVGRRDGSWADSSGNLHSSWAVLRQLSMPLPHPPRNRVPIPAATPPAGQSGSRGRRLRGREQAGRRGWEEVRVVKSSTVCAIVRHLCPQ